MVDEQERRQVYYHQNRDRIRAYYKTWYENNKNKEELKERCRLNYAVYYVKKKAVILGRKKENWLLNAEVLRERRMKRYYENKDEINRRVRELRNFHRYGINPTTISSRRTVVLDFDLNAIEEVLQVNPFRKKSPLPLKTIECQRSVTLSFD